MPVDFFGSLKFLWIKPFLFDLFYFIKIYRFLSAPLYLEVSKFWNDSL